MSNKIKWLLHKILIVILILSSMANFLSHTRVTAASGGLIIDTENIYPNMNAPYQDGYNPKVEDNKAMIVLPLYQDGVQVIQGEQITASVEYGATTDTPFVVKQYEKKISSIAVPLTEGQMKMVYLVNFDLDLKENRKNGTYPVNIRIHYKKLNIESATGPLYIEVEQVFTTYIVINDGVDPNGNTNQPQEPVTILLEHCQINPEIVGPGETFQVTAQIKNKSKTKPISNIKVSYENAEGTFLPTTNLGTLYLERIEAEQSVSVEFSMKAASTFTINQPKILLTIEYEDDKGTKYTDTESIYVAIQNQEEEPPGEIPANIFEIETKYTYEGMETPYEEGYVPVIKNDKATVILPLISLLDEKDKMKDLTASVEFGELHNKVFQMKTYERKFSLKSLDTKEGGKQSVYGIRFELDLQKERMNGVYPVTISVRGEAEGQMREQRFTIYVIIEDGLDPEDEEEEEEPSPLTPKIILKACDITP
ncbi:MAG: hypothetical protein K0S47_2576, partial [Herbinix sp.]|nr:hypothetical protein [Herbinix sp.]